MPSGPPKPSWTDVPAIRQQLMQLWVRGDLLRAALGEPGLFPYRIRPFKRPTSADYGDHLGNVREWVRGLTAEPRIRVVYRSLRHAVIGNNDVPEQAYVDTLDDALFLIRRSADADQYRALRHRLVEALPAVEPWLRARPLAALDLASEWDRLIAVTSWLSDHPRPNCYLRQLPFSGLHTKWLEQHRRTVAEWMTLITNANVPDADVPIGSIEERLGLRSRPPRIRFRLLDSSMSLLAGGMACEELTVTVKDFAALAQHPRIAAIDTIVFTENEINFLTLPPVPGAIGIFGAGYGGQAAGTPWLQQCRCWYWGDLDTNGFAILDQFRAQLPHVRSLLMDEVTLLSHRDQWVHEDTPAHRNLTRLLADERQVYENLRHDVWGDQVRLEQERVSYAWVVDRFAQALGPLDGAS